MTDNSKLATKIQLRAAATRDLWPDARPPGRIWMPCCGSGQIAQRLADTWPPHLIDACDIDDAKVQRFRTNNPAASVCTADGTDPASIPTEVYAVADIDPYGNCAPLVAAYLAHAARTAPSLLIVTDGANQWRRRSSRAYDFRTMKSTGVDTRRAQRQSYQLDLEMTRWVSARTEQPAYLLRSYLAATIWYFAIQIGGRPATDKPRRSIIPSPRAGNVVLHVEVTPAQRAEILDAAGGTANLGQVVHRWARAAMLTGSDQWPT